MEDKTNKEQKKTTKRRGRPRKKKVEETTQEDVNQPEEVVEPDPDPEPEPEQTPEPMAKKRPNLTQQITRSINTRRTAGHTPKPRSTGGSSTRRTSGCGSCGKK